MDNKNIHTSKGWFSVEDLNNFRYKKYNVAPIRTKAQLQSMCNKFAKYLKDNDYRIAVSHFTERPIKKMSLSSCDSSEPDYKYIGVDKVIRFEKVNSDWLVGQIWLEYDLLVDSYIDFFCFSDTSPEDVVTMPLEDAIQFLRYREDLVKLSCILNSYKIPSQYFLDNTFYDCLKKSWNRLGKHIVHIDCRR